MSQEQLSTASERRTDPKAFISILRPQNCVIGGLTVIAGIAIAYRMNPVGLLGNYALNFLFGYITYFFVAGGGNVVNDIFDIEVDRINRPHRALPSGRMTVRQAWAYVILLSVMGVFFAWLNGIWGSVVVIVFLIVGYAYASKVKELGLAGNFLVAFSFAFGVIYGAFVYGELVG
ncbi:MAG: UbiA family prenyltransferase, partial [Candidatus Thorarchaeota archaeon]